MKPFSGRNLNDEQNIFNYKLSIARQVIDNMFGIPANHLRCLLITMPRGPHKYHVGWF